jgi:hypothetical protein
MTQSVSAAIALAGKNLLATLSPAQDWYPYWNVEIDADLRARCGPGEEGVNWPAHNVGRWWDAMLRAEAATGLVVPAKREAGMLRNLHRVLSGPLALPTILVGESDGPLDTPGWIDKHSLREYALALAGLADRRQSAWASERVSALATAVDRYLRSDGYWANEALAADAGLDLAVDTVGGVDEAAAHETTFTHGRLLEGLVAAYEATGDGAILDLATRLAEFHLSHSTCADGSRPALPGTEPRGVVRHPAAGYHTHSLLGTYKGLLRYGGLTGQRRYVDRIATTYAETVRGEIRESGFISHDWGSETNGDIASAGDVAQIALWLSRRGHPEYLDDAARIVRARILPSQVTEVPGLEPAAGEDSDRYSDLEERVRGAFGGIYREPHGGTVPTTDVTAATVHSLCDLYAGTVDQVPVGTRVNFHFDYTDETVAVSASRDEVASVTVESMVDRPVQIRIPSWAPDDSVTVHSGGSRVDWRRLGPFATIEGRDARCGVTLTHALPERTTRETLDGTTYRITWRGDEVTGIEPNADLLPFYPDTDAT